MFPPVLSYFVSDIVSEFGRLKYAMKDTLRDLRFGLGLLLDACSACWALARQTGGEWKAPEIKGRHNVISGINEKNEATGRE